MPTSQTPYSHVFYMRNISAYQVRGMAEENSKKKKQRTQNAQSLCHRCRLLAWRRDLIVPHSHCQSDGSACCIQKRVQKGNRSKQKSVLSDSRTRKSPLPPSGNKMDLKTEVFISNDKIVYLGKQPKENQKELLPQARVPSVKTWILLSREIDSNCLFFTRTLKPHACQKIPWQFTTAQLIRLSQSISQVMMHMRNADSLSFTLISPILNSSK